MRPAEGLVAEQPEVWTRLPAPPGFHFIGAHHAPPMRAELREAVERDLIRALPDVRMAAYFAEKPDWYSDPGITVLASEAATGRVVAYGGGGMREAPDCPPFFQLSSMLIGDAHRGGAILLRLVHAVFGMMLQWSGGAFPTWVVLRTCNPKAFRAMALFDGLEGLVFYPRIDGRPQDGLMKEMAVRAARTVSPGCPFDPETGRIRGSAVPPDFYSRLPEDGPPAVRDYMARHLTASDRLLCVSLVAQQKARQVVLSSLGFDAASVERRTG